VPSGDARAKSVPSREQCQSAIAAESGCDAGTADRRGEARAWPRPTNCRFRGYSAFDPQRVLSLDLPQLGSGRARLDPAHSAGIFVPLVDMCEFGLLHIEITALTMERHDLAIRGNPRG
jgi:hypothetical protein